MRRLETAALAPLLAVGLVSGCGAPENVTATPEQTAGVEAIFDESKIFWSQNPDIKLIKDSRIKVVNDGDSFTCADFVEPVRSYDKTIDYCQPENTLVVPANAIAVWDGYSEPKMAAVARMRQKVGLIVQAGMEKLTENDPSDEDKLREISAGRTACIAAIATSGLGKSHQHKSLIDTYMQGDEETRLVSKINYVDAAERGDVGTNPISCAEVRLPS